MQKDYGGIIWTNHALDRLRQRNIKQGEAWATWKRPDSSKFDNKKGVWVYRRSINSQAIEVVAKKNEKGNWIVLSVWSKNNSNQKKTPEPLILRIIKKFFPK